MKLFDIILGAITIGLLGEDSSDEGVSGQEVNNYDYPVSTCETENHLINHIQSEQELQTVVKALMWF